MKPFLIIVSLLFVSLSWQRRPTEWCKIIPFQTTRAEVESMLGASISGTNYVLSYDTDNDRITVWYGGAKARADSECKWVMPEDMVLSFVYAPKEKFPLTKLNVDLTKFRREKAREMVNDFYYYNPAEGLTLTTRLVDGEEMLLSLERNPNEALRAKYCKKL